MTIKKHASHIAAMSVLFTLGNTIILMPGFNLINPVIALAIVLLMGALLKMGTKNKAAFLCAAVVGFLSAMYGAVTTFFDYINFLKTEQLPQKSGIFMAIVFAAIVLIFATRKVGAIYKYCLFVSVIAIAIILLCFLSGIKNFDHKFLDLKLFEISFSLQDSLPLAALLFLCKNETKFIKPTLFGVAAGFLLLFISALQTGLTFWINNDVAHPYLKAVSVISSGSLFTRLDGLVWFLFFITALVKISICVKVIFEGLKECQKFTKSIKK